MRTGNSHSDHRDRTLPPAAGWSKIIGLAILAAGIWSGGIWSEGTWLEGILAGSPALAQTGVDVALPDRAACVWPLPERLPRAPCGVPAPRWARARILSPPSQPLPLPGGARAPAGVAAGDPPTGPPGWRLV